MPNRCTLKTFSIPPSLPKPYGNQPSQRVSPTGSHSPAVSARAGTPTAITMALLSQTTSTANSCESSPSLPSPATKTGFHQFRQGASGNGSDSRWNTQFLFRPAPVLEASTGRVFPPPSRRLSCLTLTSPPNNVPSRQRLADSAPIAAAMLPETFGINSCK